MKKLLSALCGFTLLVFIGCNKNDPDPKNGNNNPPGDFSVSISNLSHSGATINWTTPTDTDGDAVTYEVIVNLTTRALDITDNSLTMTDLSGGVEYTGVVVASDGNGGTSQAAIDFRTYVMDISQFEVGIGDCPGGNNCLKSINLVDCTWQEEGGSTKCYEITYYSNPIDDDGPFCPENVEQTGGIGNYDGDGIANGGPQNGDLVGLSRLDGALFQKMENDGYDIIDPMGNIRIQTNVGGGGRSNGSTPSFCLAPTPDDHLELTFRIPVWPEDLDNADGIENVEFIGVALDGIPINGAPPSVVGNNGNIPSLDRCGVHHDPAGYLHWHFIAQNMNDVLTEEGLYEEGVFECTKITQDESALIGYARDGYPIYSSGGDSRSDAPALDNCNGHIAQTAEYPSGVYHYHASTDSPNVPTCITGRQAVNGFDKPM